MDVSASPTLALGVFTASLLGSVHCVGMCGGFACLYGGDATHGASRPLLRAHSAYHGGRLVAYVTLGAAAGALGAGLDVAGEWAGVQRAAAVMAGVLLVAWGLGLLAQALQLRVWPARLRWNASGGAARMIGHLLLRFQSRTPVVRASVLGVLTGLLPCGWLYAFVVTAAGTGSVFRGAAFMALFWAGTVPALVAIATGMQHAAGRLQRRLPVVSALLIIGFGVSALLGRVGMARAPMAHEHTTPATDNAHHTAAGLPQAAPSGAAHDAATRARSGTAHAR